MEFHSSSLDKPAEFSSVSHSAACRCWLNPSENRGLKLSLSHPSSFYKLKKKSWANYEMLYFWQSKEKMSLTPTSIYLVVTTWHFNYGFSNVLKSLWANSGPEVVWFAFDFWFACIIVKETDFVLPFVPAQLRSYKARFVNNHMI